MEIDHIVARANGGGDEEGNLATICRPCNLGKSDTILTCPVPTCAPGNDDAPLPELISRACRRRELPATESEVADIRGFGRHSIGDGLLLTITEGGARSWLARVRDGSGRRRDIGLGPFPGVTLAEARQKAGALREAVKNGEDPLVASKKRFRDIPTFREAASIVHEGLLDTWTNAKHRKEWIGTLERFVFPTIGDMPVDEIGAQQVAECLRPIWATTNVTASRVRQRVAAVLNWAYQRHYRANEAPVQAVELELQRAMAA